MSFTLSLSYSQQKVLKYTHNPNHRAVLSSTIKAFVVSLSKCNNLQLHTCHPLITDILTFLAEELESAIAQHKCSLELLELQEMLYWPPLQQICPDSYIPQVMLKCNSISIIMMLQCVNYFTCPLIYTCVRHISTLYYHLLIFPKEFVKSASIPAL